MKDPERTSIRVANALEEVASLELLQAPGLPYQLPHQLAAEYPALTGGTRMLSTAIPMQVDCYYQVTLCDDLGVASVVVLVAVAWAIPSTVMFLLLHLLQGGRLGS